ncbi:hypothetical protein FBU59_002056 [Linderina macrospora]|uniref:Uncharacterized protein n=1 Tax=Linderina macrospora TaxID=4868 RepID=A0ACC1JC28_9FUNG|nr:hypothetical protein FBU59_002056 [Linderina macrospora]
MVVPLYRGILKEARKFFDLPTRTFIQNLAKQKFRLNSRDRLPKRARQKVQKARTNLHLLERANSHRFVDMVSVLEYGYGCKGPLRVDLMRAMAGVGKREQVFGSMGNVERYRPAFYAIAREQFGEKLEVNVNVLKSRNNLNVAKMQDKRWEEVRWKIVPPVDVETLKSVERFAESGVVDNTVGMSDMEREVVRRWERRWVEMPRKRQVQRVYRELLTRMSAMTVSEVEVANPAKYRKDIVRRNGSDRLADTVPKKKYSFIRSPLAGKKKPSVANAVDLAGL